MGRPSEAGVMLSVGKDLAAVLQALEELARKRWVVGTSGCN